MPRKSVPTTAPSTADANDGASTPARHVPCPHCGQPARFSPDNPYRPFCSAHCKTQDLGAWASETFRVPEPPAHDLEGDPAQPDPPRH